MCSYTVYQMLDAISWTHCVSPTYQMGHVIIFLFLISSDNNVLLFMALQDTNNDGL